MIQGDEALQKQNANKANRMEDVIMRKGANDGFN